MTKISALPENTSPVAADSLPTYDSVNGNTKRITITRIINLIKTAFGFSAAPDSAWHYVGAVGEPAFANSWVNFEVSETTYYQLQFYKDAFGWVTIRGLIKSGTVSATLPVFTLPAGYRPLKRIRFTVVSNNLFGAVGIYETGVVHVEVGSNAYVFMDPIQFKAEQ